MFASLSEMDVDLEEVFILRGLILVRDAFQISAKGKSACANVRNLLLDTLWEHQQRIFPLQSSQQLARRQGKLLLLISTLEQLWQFESEYHVVMNAFGTIDLSGVIIELITSSPKESYDVPHLLTDDAQTKT